MPHTSRSASLTSPIVASAPAPPAAGTAGSLGASAARLTSSRRARDLGRIAPVAQLREPRRLLLLDGRDRRAAARTALRAAGERVHADHHALAGVDLPRDLVGRALDLGLLEALLDRRDRAAQLARSAPSARAAWLLMSAVIDSIAYEPASGSTVAVRSVS